MANSIEWQPPVLSHTGVAGGADFIEGFVPALTPEDFDEYLATEEVERAQANANEAEGRQGINKLNQLFALDLGDEIHGNSNQE